MSKKGTLELLVREIAVSLEPLKIAVSNIESFKSFLRQLGWAVSDLPPAYTSLYTNIQDIITDAENLIDEPDLADVLDLLESVSNLYKSLKNLSGAPAGVANPTAFIADFYEATFEYLIVRYLNLKVPEIYSFIQLSGILAVENNVSTASRPGFIHYKIDTDKIGDIIQNPTSFLTDLYQWGATDFNFEPFIKRLYEWLFSLGLNPILIDESDIEFEEIEVVIDDLESRYNIGSFDKPNGYTRIEVPLFAFRVTGEIFTLGLAISYFPGDILQELPGIIIEPTIPNSISASIPISDNWTFKLGAFTELFEKFAIIISPSGLDVRFPYQPNQVPANSGVSFRFIYSLDEPVIILGQPNASHVEFKGSEIGVQVAGSNLENFEIVADLDFQEFKIILKGGDGDGFLSKILSDREQVIESEVGISWSNLVGFNFKGGGALEVALAEHIELGPLSIDQLRLAIKSLAGPPGGFEAKITANIGLELGPFTAVVEDLGVSLKTKFEEGNVGPVDIRVGFQPPSGIGLVIDSDAVKGGGFLSFDFQNERYVGVLELSIKEKISLAVIGILTTKLPGNDDGYSLLLLITAEFEPINLGFGFTLNGVGGLIALNRTMNLQFLRDGVKAQTLDNILFPDNPVANINRIISDLESAFPVQEGRYAFGPMGIIGWGTPTLISLEIGLMIEVPSPVRLAILGVLKAIFPTEEKALLTLQINFIGTIDFEAKYITFDASLYNSKLISFPLAGDMAMRMKYGDDPIFLLSIGGFHPAFTPPPLNLPNLQRLTINLLGGNNPRLTLSTYFAVTSNTVQFGAEVDFYYKVTGKIKVIGFLGFDILIQFNPFYLIATLNASLAVVRKGKTLFGIFLSGTLEGPAPWHAKGLATFKVLRIKLKVKFDKTFGRPATTTLPDIAVLPLLEEALRAPQNWQGEAPSRSNLLVNLREVDNQNDEIVVHPNGKLGVSQKVVPLDITLKKYGTRRPSDYNKFSLDIADANNNNFTEEDVEEFFAPAEYLELSNSSKLSRKSFEKMNGGIKIQGGDELTSSFFMERQLEYEQTIIDSRHNPIKLDDLAQENDVTFQAWVQNNAAAKSKLGSKRKPLSQNAPPKVKLTQEEFAIANLDDLSLFNGMQAGSEAEAKVMLEEYLEENPSFESKLQVVSAFELV